MTSHYVIVTNKFYQHVRNDRCIVVGKFGGRTINDFRFIGKQGREGSPKSRSESLISTLNVPKI